MWKFFRRPSQVKCVNREPHEHSKRELLYFSTFCGNHDDVCGVFVVVGEFATSI